MISILDYFKQRSAIHNIGKPTQLTTSDGWLAQESIEFARTELAGSCFFEWELESDATIATLRRITRTAEAFH
jgi:hypothetical protein